MVIIINKSAASQRKVSVYRQFELATLQDLNEASHHWIYYPFYRQPAGQVTQRTRAVPSSKVPSSKGLSNKGRSSGIIYIKPATYSVFWPWQGADDSLILLIPPAFLSHLALSNRFLIPCQTELLPAGNLNDTTLDRLFLLLSQEIKTVQPGSRTYLDAISHVLGLHLLRYYCC